LQTSWLDWGKAKPCEGCKEKNKGNALWWVQGKEDWEKLKGEEREFCHLSQKNILKSKKK